MIGALESRLNVPPLAPAGDARAGYNGGLMTPSDLAPMRGLGCALVILDLAGPLLPAQDISGELRQWHDVVLTFPGAGHERGRRSRIHFFTTA